MEIKDIIKVFLLRGKKIVLLSVIATIVFTVLVFIAYPITFEAPLTLMPPENDQQMGLSSLLQGADVTSLMSGGNKVNAQLFAEILKSRTSSEYVMRKLDIQNLYNDKSFEEAVAELSKTLTVEATKEGMIKLYVSVNTPIFGRVTGKKEYFRELSATITNTYVKALDSINREKMISKARRARVYIEKQIETTKIKLDSAETKLAQFQAANKTISLPEQLKASIETAAKLKGEILQLEIQLDYLSGSMRDDNPVIIGLKKKLQSLQAEYGKLETGSNDYLPGFDKTPNLGITLANLTREVKISNEVYLLLQQQLFKESIQERKDLPTIEVLDKAIPPLKASSPRMFLVMFSFGVIVFSILFLIAIMTDRNMYNYLNIRKKQEDE